MWYDVMFVICLLKMLVLICIRIHSLGHFVKLWANGKKQYECSPDQDRPYDACNALYSWSVRCRGGCCCTIMVVVTVSNRWWNYAWDLEITAHLAGCLKAWGATKLFLYVSSQKMTQRGGFLSRIILQFVRVKASIVVPKLKQHLYVTKELLQAVLGSFSYSSCFCRFTATLSSLPFVLWAVVSKYDPHVFACICKISLACVGHSDLIAHCVRWKLNPTQGTPTFWIATSVHIIACTGLGQC